MPTAKAKKADKAKTLTAARDAYNRALQTGQRTAARDIGPLPAIVDPDRRAKCKADLALHLKTYFPAIYRLPFSKNHYRVIEKLQEVTTVGGCYALAMPRGEGKTSICIGACSWAILNAYRKFSVMLGATDRHAAKMLLAIKIQFSSNPLLLADYPEVCYPIFKLEGQARKAGGQILNGEPTKIDWKNNIAIMPTVPVSEASGSIIMIGGITSAVRGLFHMTEAGEFLRPDMVILDDPQTDESAKSLQQCEDREGILSGAVLESAGPDKTIAVAMPCTVIRRGDMADRILDRSIYPDWNGTKMKRMDSMPTRLDLWEKYKEVREEDFRADGDGTKATTFYEANRAAMDEGGSPSWPERFKPGEISAIQSAMNVFLRAPEVFAAEHQNEPLDPSALPGELTADQICRKVNQLPRGVAPLSATALTMFVDVQGKILYYAVCAWDEKFTGHVVDYGTYPDQQRINYTASDPPRPLSKVTGAGGLEACLLAGLIAINDAFIQRDWRREDGTSMRVSRCLIDANWNESTDTVYDFCRRVPGGVAMPSHGKSVLSGHAPMDAWKVAPGDRHGTGWRIPAAKGKRAVQHCMMDSNFWKSLVMQRLGLAEGNRGSLMLFNAKPEFHAMFAQHILAEIGVKVTGKGREVVEWRERRKGADNHWLDCLYGCAAAASTLGLRHILDETKEPERKRQRFSDLQREKRNGRL